MTSSIMIKLGISIFMVGAMPVSGHVLNAAHEASHTPGNVAYSSDAVFSENIVAPKALKVIQSQTEHNRVKAQPNRSADPVEVSQNRDKVPAKILAIKSSKNTFGIKSFFTLENDASSVEVNNTRSPKPSVRKTNREYKKDRPSLGTMVGVFR